MTLVGGDDGTGVTTVEEIDLGGVSDLGVSDLSGSE